MWMESGTGMEPGSQKISRKRSHGIIMTWEGLGQCMWNDQRLGITSNKDLASGQNPELVVTLVATLDEPVAVKKDKTDL